jgi:hypothetical protein
VAAQVKRLQKSVDALGRDINAARLYIAGKQWHEGSKEVARLLGYGMVYENGVDLEVVNPMTV